jgi:hypothetical protein
MADPEQQVEELDWHDTEIYSPESSDGTFDWPSKLGMAFYALLFLGVAAWIADCSIQHTRSCGESGTVDEDPNPDFPPPHCG